MWSVICMILAGGRLFFAFRPLNGKQNKKLSLRSLRLCGEISFNQEAALIATGSSADVFAGSSIWGAKFRVAK
jgi:hypothetical protein